MLSELLHWKSVLECISFIDSEMDNIDDWNSENENEILSIFNIHAFYFRY